MRAKLGDILLGLGTLALITFGVVWATGAGRSAPPSLERAVSLARSKRFEEAEQAVDRFIRAQPKNPNARMLAAQINLDRPEPKPSEALEDLAGAVPDSKPMEAMFALQRGKAHYYLGDYQKAEAQWLDALRLNPAIPEAGWSLLDLYYVQGRTDEARALAMRLRESEPHPTDRILLLLELIRQDAQPLAAPIVISRLERALKANPDDIESILGVGRALIRDSQMDEGLDRLRDAVRLAPERADVWDTLLTGLDDASRAEEFDATLARLPAAIGGDPRFAKHRGRSAQNGQKWAEAVEQYGRARSLRKDELGVAYRLSRSLRAAGDEKGAEAVEVDVRRITSAAKELGDLYDEANAIKSHGVEPHAAVYLRLADLCERMGRPAEASAWRALANVDPVKASQAKPPGNRP